MADTDEIALIERLQSDYVNFYSAAYSKSLCRDFSERAMDNIPWSRVVHDNGGYGMLGMGQGPDDVISSMQKNWVMANVMTPSSAKRGYQIG